MIVITMALVTNAQIVVTHGLMMTKMTMTGDFLSLIQALKTTKSINNTLKLFVMKYRILLILTMFLVAPCAFSQQQKNKIDYKNQSYDLVFDSPNSILSVIPLESLPKVGTVVK